MRLFLILLFLLWLILFFFQTDLFAKPVAKALGTTPERVKSVAGAVIPSVITLALIAMAVVFAAVPVLGIVLAVVALVASIVTLWSYFSNQSPSLNGPISGLGL